MQSIGLSPVEANPHAMQEQSGLTSSKARKVVAAQQALEQEPDQEETTNQTKSKQTILKQLLISPLFWTICLMAMLTCTCRESPRKQLIVDC